jgi:pseudouridine synthase
LTRPPRVRRDIAAPDTARSGPKSAPPRPGKPRRPPVSAASARSPEDAAAPARAARAAANHDRAAAAPARERLQKVLAHAGVASRRAAEEMISAGRVQVNGVVVTQLGTRIDPARDTVTLDGERVRVPVDAQEEAASHVVYLLHKPLGVVSTANDPQGRRTVTSLLPPEPRVYPVGRLDADSEGLLLLTNDGDLAYRLTHPRYGVEKEYEALVTGHPPEHELRRLRAGVRLADDERPTAPAQVQRLADEGANTWLRVIIHEGRKRQVRRMLDAIHHPVLHLRRVRLGPLRLGNLKPGQWRPLTVQEVAALQAASRLGAAQAPAPRRTAPEPRLPAPGFPRTEERHERPVSDRRHLRPRRVDHPEGGRPGRRRVEQEREPRPARQTRPGQERRRPR